MKLQVFGVNMHRVGAVLLAAGLIAGLSLAFSMDANAGKLLSVPAPHWDGNANLSFSQYIAAPDTQFGAVDDVDGDGDLDVVTTSIEGNTLVLHNDGLGNFAVEQTFTFPGFSHVGIVMGNLDADDYPDVLLFDNNLRDNLVLWNNDDGSGTFSNGGSAFWSDRDSIAALGDLDGDGDLDVFVVAGLLPYDGKIRTWVNDGEGNFSLLAEFDDAYKHTSLALGDLNRDGDLDAFTTSWENGYNKVWLNDDTGNFVEHQSIPGAETMGVSLGDLDGDGDLDAYLANSYSSWVNLPDEVWFNDGSGTFVKGQTIDAASTFWAALGDLDGDDDLDVYISSSPMGNVPDEIWVNDGSGFFSLRRTLVDDHNGGGGGLFDIDNDGDLDATSVATNQGVYFLKNGDWRQARPIPQAVSSYGFAQCADQPDSFYVIGGYDGVNGLDEFWRYDVISDTWTPLASIPVLGTIVSPTSVCYDGQIYILTGDPLRVYDIATNSWTLLGVIPRFAGNAAAGAWNGKLYRIGGAQGWYDDPPFNYVDIYDIATGTWKLNGGTPAPQAVLGPGYTQVGQYLYLVGGTGLDSPAHNVDIVQRYDMASDSWETIPFPSARGLGISLAYNGTTLYAIGGDLDGNDYLEVTDMVETLDLSTWPEGTWELYTDTYPYPVLSASAGFCSEAKTGGEIWSVGGASGTLEDPDFLHANSYHSTGEACINYDVDLSDSMFAWGNTGDIIEYSITITNTGTVTDYFNVEVSSTWDVDPISSESGPLGPGETMQVVVEVVIPPEAMPGEPGISTVNVTSMRDASIADTTQLITTVFYKTYSPLTLKN